MLNLTDFDTRVLGSNEDVGLRSLRPLYCNLEAQRLRCERLMGSRNSFISNTDCKTLPAGQDTRRLAWRLTFAFALFYLAFLPPGIYSVDGNSMLGVAESLVLRHSIALAPSFPGT